MKRLFIILFSLLIVQCQEQAINNSSKFDEVTIFKQSSPPLYLMGPFLRGMKLIGTMEQ